MLKKCVTSSSWRFGYCGHGFDRKGLRQASCTPAQPSLSGCFSTERSTAEMSWNNHCISCCPDDPQQLWHLVLLLLGFSSSVLPARNRKYHWTLRVTFCLRAERHEGCPDVAWHCRERVLGLEREKASCLSQDGWSISTVQHQTSITTWIRE